MTRFFPTEIVQHLTRGSYERTIAKLEEALQTENLFEGSDAHVLGTFSGYALVASDEGNCARVKYEDLGTEVKIVSHESVELLSYGEDDLSSFLEAESSKVIELWQKGQITEATRRLRALSSISDSWELRQEGAFEKWVSALEQERPWVRVLDEKREIIEGALQEKIDTTLRSKFRKLYDGSTRTEDMETYRSLVLENLDQIRETTGALLDDMKRMKNTVEKLASQYDEGSVVSALVAFSEDLLEDLSRIDTIAERSTKHVTRVDQLGRLHDLMTDRLSKAETAKHFVDTMAQRLSESQ